MICLRSGSFVPDRRLVFLRSISEIQLWLYAKAARSSGRHFASFAPFAVFTQTFKNGLFIQLIHFVAAIASAEKAANGQPDAGFTRDPLPGDGSVYFSFPYCSSSTGSSHSAFPSFPGTSMARCWNQLSHAAPCQCLTPSGMFTTSPGWSSRASFPHS